MKQGKKISQKVLTGWMKTIEQDNCHILSILSYFQMLLHKDLNKITLHFITTSLTNYNSGKNEAKYISLK